MSVHSPPLRREGRLAASATASPARRPACSTSRAVFFAGRFPFRTNVLGALGPDDLANSMVSPFETTAPKLLSRRGYESALFGKFHITLPGYDPAGVLKEIARVLRPCGRLAVLVDFYAENVESHRWADEIAVPMHLLAARDYSRLFEDAGFVAVRTERLLDPSPLPPRESFEPSWGFETWEQLARYRAEGTLFVLGERP